MNGTVGEGLTHVQSFAELFAAGVQARLEQEVAVEGAEIARTSNADLEAEVADGALIARVLWDENGDRRTGCLLWTGQLGLLLGDESRTAGSLTEEEVATLDASLRLSVEEGAQNELPFEWSALEKVSADGLASALRQGGTTTATECARAVIRLGEAQQAFLLVPSDTIASAESVGASAASSSVAEAAGSADAVAEIAEHVSDLHRAGLRNLEQLLDVRLPLTIRLGSTRMPLDDVLRLAPGSVVELDRSEDEPLEVLANGRVIARGEVVVVDERFGLRITEIGSAEERIRATI